MLPLYLFPVWAVSSGTQPVALISVKVLYTITRLEQPMSRIVETDRDGHDLQERIFSYSRRNADLPTLRVQYAQAEPFPHIVLDRFLQPWAAECALAEFPSIDSSDWIQYKHVNENKLGKGDRSSFGPDESMDGNSARAHSAAHGW